MEVDASDAGVGAVLSQQQSGKLHSCAYFSRRLSPAEGNYDVGDRTASHQARPGGVASLAGERCPAIRGVDGPQEFGVYSVS